MIGWTSDLHIVIMSDPLLTVTHYIVLVYRFEWLHIELVLPLIVESTIQRVKQNWIVPNNNIPPILAHVF